MYIIIFRYIYIYACIHIYAYMLRTSLIRNSSDLYEICFIDITTEWCDSIIIMILWNLLIPDETVEGIELDCQRSCSWNVSGEVCLKQKLCVKTQGAVTIKVIALKPRFFNSCLPKSYFSNFPIILKFCTEHGSVTAMLSAKFQNDLPTYVMLCMDEILRDLS